MNKTLSYYYKVIYFFQITVWVKTLHRIVHLNNKPYIEEIIYMLDETTIEGSTVTSSDICSIDVVQYYDGIIVYLIVPQPVKFRQYVLKELSLRFTMLSDDIVTVHRVKHDL